MLKALVVYGTRARALFPGRIQGRSCDFMEACLFFFIVNNDLNSVTPV